MILKWLLLRRMCHCCRLTLLCRCRVLRIVVVEFVLRRWMIELGQLVTRFVLGDIWVILLNRLRRVVILFMTMTDGVVIRRS